MDNAANAPTFDKQSSKSESAADDVKSGEVTSANIKSVEASIIIPVGVETSNRAEMIKDIDKLHNAPVPLDAVPAKDAEISDEAPAVLPSQAHALKGAVAWTRPVKPKLPWVYKPVPEGPHKHDEAYESERKSPQGWPVLGARARGKKHKHEGTNCDDWYEFGTAGSWTIIAVSDGGGSYQLSRVGAKTACRAAIDQLAERFAAIEPKELESPTKLESSEMCEQARKAIIEAMRCALTCVLDAVNEERVKREKTIQSVRENLSHDDGINLESKHAVVTERDFYCTLLLCAHTQIRIGNKQYSMILGCSVGDGMIAAVTKNAVDGSRAVTLLMKSDGGEFSGETEFLTRRMVQEDMLKGKLFISLNSSPCCIMVMTDGVSDDYFPNNPRIAELYADLVLNRIVAQPKCDTKEVIKALAETEISTHENLSTIPLWQSVDRLLWPDQVKETRCASVKVLASALGLSTEVVVGSDALLCSSVQYAETPLTPEESAASKRLLEWLDSYHEKASFDDRTLVVLDEGDYS